MRSWNKDNVNILLSHVPWEKDPHSFPRPSSLLSPTEISSWSFMSVFLSDECPQKRIYPLRNLWEIRFRRFHCCKQPWGRLRKWARLCSRTFTLEASLSQSWTRAHMKTNDHANQNLIFSPNKFEWPSSSRLGAAKVFSKGDAQSRALSQLSTCEHKCIRGWES